LVRLTSEARAFARMQSLVAGREGSREHPRGQREVRQVRLRCRRDADRSDVTPEDLKRASGGLARKAFDLLSMTPGLRLRGAADWQLPSEMGATAQVSYASACFSNGCERKKSKDVARRVVLPQEQLEKKIKKALAFDIVL
jgi:hypothetical protein